MFALQHTSSYFFRVYNAAEHAAAHHLKLRISAPLHVQNVLATPCQIRLRSLPMAGGGDGDEVMPPIVLDVGAQAVVLGALHPERVQLRCVPRTTARAVRCRSIAATAAVHSVRTQGLQWSEWVTAAAPATARAGSAETELPVLPVRCKDAAGGRQTFSVRCRTGTVAPASAQPHPARVPLSWSWITLPAAACAPCCTAKSGC